jgi:AraC-like DNA-binding protein
MPPTQAFSHQPSPGWQRFAYSILRAGRMASSPGRVVERRRHPGHDWLLVLAGSGSVTSCGVTATAEVGDLVWIDNRLPHRHVANRQRPWDLLWLRCDGPGLGVLHRALGIDGDPVISNALPAQRHFTTIIDILADGNGPSPARDALLAAEVAKIIAVITGLRWPQPNRSGDRAIARACVALAADLARTWCNSDFCRLANLPPSTLYRRFRRSTGSSPMDYLRRLRIAEAQSLLLASDQPIAEVAGAVGFTDPFHFSRLFRRYAGLSPRAFRLGE